MHALQPGLEGSPLANGSRELTRHGKPMTASNYRRSSFENSPWYETKGIVREYLETLNRHEKVSFTDALKCVPHRTWTDSMALGPRILAFPARTLSRRASLPLQVLQICHSPGVHH